MRTSTKTVFTFLNKVFLSAVAFVNSALAARYLGKADRVQFQFAGTVTATGTTFVGGYTGYYAFALPKSPDDVNDIVQTGNLFVLCVCLAVWAAAWVLHSVPGLHISPAWWWAIVCMPLNFIFGYGTRLLQGSNEIAWLNRANTIQPVLFLALYGPLWLDRHIPEHTRLWLTYWIWVISFALAAAATMAIAFWRLRRLGLLTRAMPSWRSLSRKHLRGTFDYGSWLSLSYVVNYANLRMDFWWILALLPPRVASDYGIAVTASEVLVTIANSVASVVFTRMTGGSRADAIRITETAVRQTMISAGAVSILMYATFPWLIVAAFGQRYGPSVPPFVILLPGLIFRAGGLLIIQYATNQLGNPKISIWMNALSAVICAVVCALLIRPLALAGGALASTVSYVVSYFVYVWWFCRTTGSRPAQILLIRRSDLAPYREILRQVTRRVARWVRHA